LDESALTCAFTGYRPDKLPFGFNMQHPDCLRLKHVLLSEIEKLIQNNVTHFLTGMAMGTDMLCAELVLSLKRKYPLILECIIPCKDQYKHWPKAEQERYQSILNKSDNVVYITETAFTRGCMHRRNRFLVDHAQHILAVYNGKTGGTQKTIEYARQKNRNIIIIDPELFVRILCF
jgi:uncharacterized phage-like protein YoqJ